MNFIYYLATFVFNTSATYANQKYARNLKSYAELFVYAIVTGCVASLFFYAISGFCIKLNGITLLYSGIFALVVISGYYCSLPVYRFMGVAEAGVFSSTLKLTLSYIFGILLYDENVDIRAIIRFLIMILCSLFMYLSLKKKVKSEKSVTFKGILLCIGTALVGVLATVISKSFAGNKNVTDENSFFFITNIFICAFSLLAIIVINKGNPAKAFISHGEKTTFKYLMIVVSTVSANMCSLLQIWILAGDAINLYVPISGAIGIISSALIALVFEHEKPPVIPILLACAAFFI